MPRHAEGNPASLKPWGPVRTRDDHRHGVAEHSRIASVRTPCRITGASLWRTVGEPGGAGQSTVGRCIDAEAFSWQ
jgi:hypothetical protein